jgi:hypothetical protein
MRPSATTSRALPASTADVSVQTSLLAEPVPGKEGERRLVFGEHLGGELLDLVCLRPRHRLVQERTGDASPSPLWTDAESQLDRARIVERERQLADDAIARLSDKVNVADHLDQPRGIVRSAARRRGQVKRVRVSG